MVWVSEERAGGLVQVE